MIKLPSFSYRCKFCWKKNNYYANMPPIQIPKCLTYLFCIIYYLRFPLFLTLPVIQFSLQKVAINQFIYFIYKNNTIYIIKKEGLYKNKVNSSLDCNCEIGYYCFPFSCRCRCSVCLYYGLHLYGGPEGSHMQIKNVAAN